MSHRRRVVPLVAAAAAVAVVAAAAAVPVVAADVAALGEAIAGVPPRLLHLSTALCTQRIQLTHHGGISDGDGGSASSAAFPQLEAVAPTGPATAAGLTSTDVDAAVAAHVSVGNG